MKHLSPLIVALFLGCTNDSIEKLKKIQKEDNSIVKASDLFTKNNCNACHATNEIKVGPSWLMIINKYENIPSNRDKLKISILNGSINVWGKTPMPANTSLDTIEIDLIIDSLYKMNL
jgi:cytochrome c551/c552